jgi:hypothetical protein
MWTRRFALCCTAALLAGCVPIVSLHPLFTKENIVFEEKLLGTWVKDANDPEVTWVFSRLDPAAAEGILEPWRDELDRFYRLSITDEDGRKGTFAACLVRLGERLFLDVLPDRFPSDEQDIEKMKLVYNGFFFVPVHTFIRVDAIGEELAIRITDDERFKDLIEAEPTAVRCEEVNERIVLTASTAQLQAFVANHAGDERLFPNDLTLIRKPK